MKHFNAYIQALKTEATEITTKRGVWLYKIKSYWVRFEERQGALVNQLSYTHENDCLFWEQTTPESFYEAMINPLALRYIEHSIRFEKDPRLPRPAALQSAPRSKAILNEDGQGRTDLFIKEGDVWLKYRNDLKDKDPAYPKELWICLQNLYALIQNDTDFSTLLEELLNLQTHYYGANWSFFSFEERRNWLRQIIQVAQKHHRFKIQDRECLAG